MAMLRFLAVLLIGVLISAVIPLALLFGIADFFVYVANGHLVNDIVTAYHHIRNVLNN